MGEGRSLLRDGRGASLVEYVLLIGMIAVVCLGGLRAFGSRVDGKVTAQAACIESMACAGASDSGAYPLVEAGVPGATSEAGTIEAGSEAGSEAGTSEAGTGEGGLAAAGTLLGVVSEVMWTKVAEFGKGFVVDGLWGTVTGVVDAIAHPLDTVSDLYDAVTHPLETLEAIEEAVVQSWNENPERTLGAGVFEVVTLPFAGLKVAKVAKAARVARVARAVEARRLALEQLASGFRSVPMLPDNIGEHLPNRPGNRRTVQYLDDAGRAKFKVTVEDGRLYDAEGNLFDTTRAVDHFHGHSGRAIFVMDEHGNIFASNEPGYDEFHHSSLAAGQPVTGAGELEVRDGVVVTISNQSGHYQPSAQINEQVIDALETQGVDTRHIVRDNWK